MTPMTMTRKKQNNVTGTAVNVSNTKGLPTYKPIVKKVRPSIPIL